jgi:predicted nucleic acid-binding protein
MPANFSGKVIISDTSCLIALTNTGHFDVLKEIFGTVVITPEVLGEYGDPLPEWITVQSASDANRIKLIQNTLDLGEASSIALALETQNSLLILDDGLARIYALDMGLEITGTLGLLIAAYEQGVISDITAVIQELKNVDFRLPPDVDDIIASL